MSGYLVKFDELNSKNIRLKELITKVEQCINNLEQSLIDIEWEGTARDDFFIAYNGYIDELKELHSNLITCLNVSNTYHNDFNEIYKNAQNKIRKLNDNMVTKWKE